MLPKIKLALAFGLLAVVFGLQSLASAQESTAKTLKTGIFHGKVHQTSGRATIYEEADGKLVLRLTNFKTSNGPDVHVILVAVKDAKDDANFLKSDTARVELGKRCRSIANALTRISEQRLWRNSNAGKRVAHGIVRPGADRFKSLRGSEP